MVRFNCLMASAQTGKNQSQLLLAFVGVLLLFELFLITPCCVAAANKLVIEEGSNIDLIFTLKKDGFVFIKLHKNNEVIFGIEGAAKYNKRSKPINVTAVENTTIFTITDVDSTDDGEYKCFKSGVLQEPQYLVTVISSKKLTTTEYKYR
ncbi:uncharacterized protein [Apostichopus japonicus]|uniref:uncharacterized protein n=1 Tax=Stichopus japonicus TaxID=307972 RepID=UPI003AB6FFCA